MDRGGPRGRRDPIPDWLPPGGTIPDAPRRPCVGNQRASSLHALEAVRARSARGSAAARCGGCAGAQVDLERGLVTVPASSAKSRREQTVELHARLVAALKAAKPEGVETVAPIVPGHLHPMPRTPLADLNAAKVAPKDAEGRVVDLHALRTKFVSWLGATGAHPRTAQALAPHANIETTMQRYTDLRLFDLKAAVDRLPVPSLVYEERVGDGSEDLSLPASPSGVVSMPSDASRCAEEGSETPSRKRAQTRNGARGRALERVGAPGLEPGTDGLKGPAASLATSDGARTCEAAGGDLSPPASPRPAPMDPVCLADLLLAEAERHPNPAPLIAAARALLAHSQRQETGGWGSGSPALLDGTTH
jgi:hypothetical protein